MSLDISQSLVLIVDDTPANIKLLVATLEEDYRIGIAKDGVKALQFVEENKPDLILLDIMMPEMDGFEVCSRLKANPKTKDIPIMLISALLDVYEKTKGFKLGAVDYITKPFEILEVQARVRTHLEHKLYHDKLERLVENRTLSLQNAMQELDKANSMIKAGYREAIFMLTLASEFKDEDTGNHIKRVSLYTKELADVIGMNAEFIDTIYHASPMHDIGKVAIPDNIIMKPAELDVEEWEKMKTHTVAGAKILEGSNSPYLQMAMDIARSHHERWDGTGYPNGLKGEEIPLAARIMNLADQYDALRSKRPYKSALDHETVVKILTKGDGRTMPEHFDPVVLGSFRKCLDKFREIIEEYK